MADIVNLQQCEYDAAVEKLAALHEDSINQVSKISKEIRELSAMDGGFYRDNISAKIELLLDTLETGIMDSTGMNMEASKTSMDSFAEIIVNVDTACNV